MTKKNAEIINSTLSQDTRDPMMGSRNRVVIENVQPQVEGGRYPIKRVVGESVLVTADLLSDGHDALCARLLYRHSNDPDWTEIGMEPNENDRWSASFRVSDTGIYYYTVEAWVDRFKTWQVDFMKRAQANQPLGVHLRVAVELLEGAIQRAPKGMHTELKDYITILSEDGSEKDRAEKAMSDSLARLMREIPDRSFSNRSTPDLSVVVERKEALFSTWYERFPRSCSPKPGQHGTLKDCIALLPEIARMGFDVFYLPPIHPVGRTNRKGKNNAEKAGKGDVGSPWAIGSSDGGHKSIHPDLGTMEDFRTLLTKAREHGIEIAMDIAFQCSPDHPYVKEHPEWFRWLPDGTVQYAENPPKKYQDILPLNFETENWKELWEELKSVVMFWAESGVRFFRVDNPHTKPFAFWEWLIRETRALYPDLIFLSEAFTRPKIMYRLAKIGFTQSYTYFTWRNTKPEFTEYITHLLNTEVREFFRPNFWPNTPDILPEHLQYGGRPAFMIRAALAATLSSNYGIYGPAFELCVSEAVAGKEEYLNSEKYELRHWDWDAEGNLKDYLARLNQIRRENPALQTTWNLKFRTVDNEYLLFYSKTDEEMSNIILVVVNLDPFHTQSGWVTVPIHELGIPDDQPYLVHELLTDARYIWHGERNYVQLDPHSTPAHLFRVRKRLKRETDFDYYF